MCFINTVVSDGTTVLAHQNRFIAGEHLVVKLRSKQCRQVRRQFRKAAEISLAHHVLSLYMLQGKYHCNIALGVMLIRLVRSLTELRSKGTLLAEIDESWSGYEAVCLSTQNAILP